MIILVSCYQCLFIGFAMRFIVVVVLFVAVVVALALEIQKPENMFGRLHEYTS